MTYRQIEASREIRLWLGQVIVPTAVGVLIYLSNDDLRKELKHKCENAKNFIQTKVLKK